MPRILVVCYSRSGHTRAVAQEVAAALGADLEELHDHVERGGYVGYLRTALEGVLGASTEIDPPRNDPARYDLVVVGSPVFAAGVSSPVRTYLWLERERLPRLAFLASYGGAGSDRTFGQMAAVAAKAPVATLAVREKELAAGSQGRAIASFAAAIRSALAPPVLAAAPEPATAR